MLQRIKCLEDLRARGWDIGIYRSCSEGWLGGVCAGLGARSDLPNWVIRASVIGLFFFSGSLVIWLYFLACFVIAPETSRWAHRLPKTEVKKETLENNFGNNLRDLDSLTANDLRSVLKRSRDRKKKAIRDIEAMEAYVASREYDAT